MRVLFCAPPGEGHVRPMLPLMQALHRRGHALAWAGAAETHALVQGHVPVTCFEAGPGRHSARFKMVGRWPDLAEARGADGAARMFPRLFGAVLAPAMLPGLRLAMQAHAPDLVVGGTAALAVPLVAQLGGCLHVTHGFGMPLTPHRLQEAAAELEPLWQQHARQAAPPDAGLYRHLYLDIYPHGLQHDPLPKDLPSQAMQAVDVTATPAVALRHLVPSWFDNHREFPLVYLTLGTVLNRPDLLRMVVSALASLPLRVVVTTGPDIDPVQLQPLPPHVHAQQHIPQAELMPHCQIVVSHGGSGTLLAACAHGLPHLALPQMADQFVNAAALERSGAGLALMGAELNLYAIREAVQRLLSDPAFREAAERLGREMAALPGVDDIAVELEHTVARGHALPPQQRLARFRLPT